MSKKINLETIAHSLESMPSVLEGLLAHLDDELLSWQADAETWSVKQIIGHLIDADQAAFEERIKFIIANDGAEIPGWSANKAAAERHDNDMTIAEILAEFQNQRARAARFLRGLDPALLTKRGTMPKHGTFLASDFVLEWPYHDYDHLQQMMDCLKPHSLERMSDTMRQALA